MTRNTQKNETRGGTSLKTLVPCLERDSLKIKKNQLYETQWIGIKKWPLDKLGNRVKIRALMDGIRIKSRISTFLKALFHLIQIVACVLVQSFVYCADYKKLL